MPLNYPRQLRQIARFGALARYIDCHLDDELDLAQLADIACLSRHRLDNDFHAYASETPISRVWRLRLLRAQRHICEQPERPLLDLALDAGYGSAQAFSRAFRRLHGKPPSAFRRQVRPARPSLRIEILPEMATQYIPYTGERGDLIQASHELRARAMSAGIDKKKRFGWQVNIENLLAASSNADRIGIQASLLHEPLETRIAGLDRGRLPGGEYAVFHFFAPLRMPTASELIARIEQETAWRVAEGPWLRRCRNAQYLPSVLENCFEIYIPVRARRSEVTGRPERFILEK